MKIRKDIVEDKQLRMEIGGEGHTLLNLIQRYLLEVSNVKMAGYSKPHPLMDRSYLYVSLKRGKNFDNVLIKATNDADKELKNFQKKFEAEVSKKK
jgi:DNA-directed RNA polymerase subunit L